MEASSVCYKNHQKCLLNWIQLQFLADLTVTCWKRLLRMFGVDNHIIDNVEEDGANKQYLATEIAYRGYLQWQHSFPLQASFCVLFPVLADAGRNDIIKDMKKKFCIEGTLI